MIEIWEDCIDKNYQISNKGIVRSKDKKGNYSHSSLGREYNVTKQNITMILTNKSRKI